MERIVSRLGLDSGWINSIRIIGVHVLD